MSSNQLFSPMLLLLLTACIVGALKTEHHPSENTRPISSNPTPQIQNTADRGLVNTAGVNQKQEQGQHETSDLQRSESDYGYNQAEGFPPETDKSSGNENDVMVYNCVDDYNPEYCQYFTNKYSSANGVNSVHDGYSVDSEDSLPSQGHDQEKRRLRFGKRRLRFVKKDNNGGDVAGESLNEKRRLRFIKKNEEEKVKHYSPEKRRLRFIKKSNDDETLATEKRRLRFIKRGDDDENDDADIYTPEKRRLRFIKKNEKSDSSSPDKRRLRFIKKSSDDQGVYSPEAQRLEFLEKDYEGDASPMEKRRLRFIKRNYALNDGQDNGWSLVNPSAYYTTHAASGENDDLYRSFADQTSNQHEIPMTSALKSTAVNENMTPIYNAHKILRRSTPVADSVVGDLLDSVELDPAARSKRVNSIGLQRSLVGYEIAAEAQRRLQEEFRRLGRKRSSQEVDNPASDSARAKRINSIGLQRSLIGYDIAAEAERRLREEFIRRGRKRSSPDIGDLALESTPVKRANSIGLQRSLIAYEIAAEAERRLREKFLNSGKKRSATETKSLNMPSDEEVSSRIWEALLKESSGDAEAERRLREEFRRRGRKRSSPDIGDLALESTPVKRANSIGLQRSLIAYEIAAEAERRLREKFLNSGKKRSATETKSLNMPSDEEVSSRIWEALLKESSGDEAERRLREEFRRRGRKRSSPDIGDLALESTPVKRANSIGLQRSLIAYEIAAEAERRLREKFLNSGKKRSATETKSLNIPSDEEVSSTTWEALFARIIG